MNFKVIKKLHYSIDTATANPDTHTQYFLFFFFNIENKHNNDYNDKKKFILTGEVMMSINATDLQVYTHQ